MHKEKKQYYAKDTLNRGYAHKSQSDTQEHHDATLEMDHRYNPLKNFLPPVEVMSQYEKEFPGSFAKIIDLVQKEQDTMHQISKLSIEANYRAMRMGKVFGFLVICIMCGTAVRLAQYNLNTSIIFTIFAFGSVFGVSFFSYLNTNQKRNAYKGNRHGFHNKNKSEFYKNKKR